MESAKFNRSNLELERAVAWEILVWMQTRNYNDNMLKGVEMRQTLKKYKWENYMMKEQKKRKTCQGPISYKKSPFYFSRDLTKAVIVIKSQHNNE